MYCNAILRPTTNVWKVNAKSTYRKYKRHIWFFDVGLHMFGRASVHFLWRPRKHVYSSLNITNILFETEFITPSGLHTTTTTTTYYNNYYILLLHTTTTTTTNYYYYILLQQLLHTTTTTTYYYYYYTRSGWYLSWKLSQALLVVTIRHRTLLGSVK